MDLIRYARRLDVSGVDVVVCTQPDEPFTVERVTAIRDAILRERLTNVYVYHVSEEIPQEPEESETFWQDWQRYLNRDTTIRQGDYIVSSEMYGVEAAKELGLVFMPYDLNRTVNYTKATLVRESPGMYFEQILPEFRKHLQKRVTFFGAESVGKTTMARRMSACLGGTWLFEWARPYLEAVGPEVTVDAMKTIHQGQKALQLTGSDHGTEFIFQDTDLFSTVGYWEMWSKETMPLQLLNDARNLKSDLYVILSSDIPFEADPLRYGGHERESSDQYWIDLCEREGLNYVYVTGTDDRFAQALNAIHAAFPDDYLEYQRRGKEYAH